MPLDPSVIQPNTAVLQSIANPQPLPTVADIQAKQLALQNARLQLQSGTVDAQQKQRELDAQQALDTAMSSRLKQNPDGSVSFDHDAIAGDMTARGFGHLVPALQESWTKADQAKATLNKTNQDIAELQNKAQGELRDHMGLLAQGIADQNYVPEAAITAIGHADLDPAKAQKLIQQIQANPTPEFVKSIIDPIRAQSPAVQELLTKRQTAAASKQTAETGAAKFEAEKPKIAADTIVSQQAATAAQGAAANLRLLRAAGKGPDVWAQALSQESPDVQKAYANLGKNPTLGQVQQAGMTGEQQVTAEQGAQRLGIERVRANAENALAQFNQADRETKVFGAPFQTALTGAQGQLARINEAQQMLMTGNAETQALAIPKVLSALVSGQGSGVRITQSELNSIGGARGIAGDVQGWLQKMGSGQKLTPDQSRQLQGILVDTGSLIARKMDTATQTLQAIENAPDRPARIAATQKGRDVLNSIVGGSSEPPLPAQLSASDVGKTFFSKQQNKPIKVTAVNPNDPTQFKWQPVQ